MKLEKLTPEQEKLMLETRDEWINLAFYDLSKGIDKPMFEDGVKWLYCDLLKKPMPKVIYCDSWLCCVLTIFVLKEMSKKEKQNFKIGASVGASVRASVRASVGASVWASVEASVGDSVRASVGDSVRASVKASVVDSVRASVRASVRDSVGASVRASVGDYVGENFGQYSNWNGWSNFGFIAWGDFYEKINIIDNFNFRQYKKLIKSRCFNAYEYENFIFAIEPPVKIDRNAQGLLNNTEDSSVKFKDGSEYFFVNGRAITEKYFKSISNKTFTVEDFSKEENEEYKSTCIAMMQEKYGDEYLVNFFRQNLQEIDTFTDKKEEMFLEGTTKGMNVGVYTLFKGEINNEKIAYVRCYCPSTDRMFFLGVDSDNETAKQAIASLYRIPKKLKGHIKSISRQGERFSTILTEDGKNTLKTLSKEEIADVSSVSGDKYFSLMKYEY